MRHWKSLLLLVLVSFLFSLLFAPQTVSAEIPAEWSGPDVIWDDGNYPANFSMSADGSCVVALLPYSGADEYSRHIAVIHKVGGAWQTPQIIAANGRHSDDPFQVLPANTHPVISGDGQTIVYLGWSSARSTNAAFVVTRLAGNTWSTPIDVTPTLANVHDDMSLSYDGTVLTLTDYPFWETQQVYILTRSGASWSQPVQVTPDPPGMFAGGGSPSLSADGLQLTYVQNARLMCMLRSGTTWSYPEALTDNLWEEYQVAFPRFSPDGTALFYWYIRLEVHESSYVMMDQDLYLRRKTQSGWSAPEKITPEPVIHSSRTEGPAAVNVNATRFIYPRNIVVADTHAASDLEMREFINGSWQTTQFLQNSGGYDYLEGPVLTPDSATLVFGSSERFSGESYVYGGLWTMTRTPDIPTNTAPSFTSEPQTVVFTNNTYTYNISTFDPDSGDTLEVTAPVLPGWLMFTDHGDGSASLSGTPTPAYLGDHPVSLLVSDEDGLTDTQTFTLSVLTNPTTIAVISSEGGTLYSEIDQVLYEFEPATFPAPTEVSHTAWPGMGGYPPPPAPPPPPPLGTTGIGIMFDLTAKNLNDEAPVQPAQPVSVTIDYGSAEEQAAIPGTLKLYRVEGETYNPVDSTDDPVKGQLKASLNHFSCFIVLGEAHQVFLPFVGW